MSEGAAPVASSITSQGACIPRDEITSLMVQHRSTARPTWLTSGRVPSLDGMRAVAILAVLIEHLGSQLPHVFSHIPTYGHLGVECFFVISGFLITLLLLREHERSGTISIKGFFKRRFLRILPASLVYLLCPLALTLFGIVHISRQYWIAALTYTMCYMPHFNRGWGIGHFWSLSVEEHFYFIWPLLFLWLKPRRSMQVAIAYIAATPLLRFAIALWFSRQLDIDYCSLTQMSSIAIGCVLALILKGYGLPSLERLIRTRRRLILLLGLLILVLSMFAQRSGKYDILLGDPVNAASVALIMGGILYAEQSLVSRVLNTKVLVWVGVLSYSLYLWQQPFTSPEARHFGLFANVLFITLAAFLSYRLVETPFLRLKGAVKRTGTTTCPSPSNL